LVTTNNWMPAQDGSAFEGRAAVPWERASFDERSEASCGRSSPVAAIERAVVTAINSKGRPDFPGADGHQLATTSNSPTRSWSRSMKKRSRWTRNSVD